MNYWLKENLPKLSRVLTEEIVLEQPFEKAVRTFAHQKGTVILLSGSDLDSSQYHIMGINPWIELKGKKNQFVLSCKNGRQHPEYISYIVESDIFSFLNDLINHMSLPDGILKQSPFMAGFMGYFAYDLKDLIENLPRTCIETYLPDLCLYVPSAILVQNKAQKTDHATIFIPIPEGKDEKSYTKILKDSFVERLHSGSTLPEGHFSVAEGKLQPSITKTEYIRAVKKIIKYLKEGDIYQANFAQRFETRFSGDVYTLFLKLFEKNPAPFFAYINADDHQIVSTSPERFVKVVDNKVETRPIKGTIARGQTSQKDIENRNLLSSNFKDDAELTMIVDLIRNDLSRVTKSGSVIVSEHKRLEPYDNVFHLLSVVQGELNKGQTCVDLLKATFPGGSITGCPKIRAMEIIDELEKVRRHVYSGSIGYISFHKTMDLSIAIRTAIVTGGNIYFSVGGGIVYDSDPEKEFQETLDKGKTLLDVLYTTSRMKKTTPARIWMNGCMVDSNQATISVFAPGFQYGAGVFETIRVENRQPLRLKQHIQRMEQAWQDLFELDPPDITWDHVIDLVISENNLETGSAAVKILACLDRKYEEDQSKPSIFLTAFARRYAHRLSALKKKGLDVVIYPFARQTPLANFKTMNYLFYEKAKAYAHAHHGNEALILNSDLTVSETNTANILIKNGNKIILPISEHVLPGVTIKAAIKGLQKLGFEIIHRRLTVDELILSGNVILTNALMGAVIMERLNGEAVAHDSDFCSLINGILFSEIY